MNNLSPASTLTVAFLFFVVTRGAKEIDLFAEGRSFEYKLVNDVYDFKTGHEICVKGGGRLAIVKTPAERQTLLKANPGMKEAFVGLSDRGLEGDFRWVNGAARDTYGVSLLPFTSGEPDNEDGDEDCAVMTKPDGRLSDVGCNIPSAFICQTPPTPLKSNEHVVGVIFNSTTNGALRIDFEDNDVMRIRGMVGSITEDINIGLVLIHNPDTSTPLCPKPLRIFSIFKNFKSQVKMIPVDRKDFGGRHIIDVSINGVKDISPSHYAIAAREVGYSFDDMGCRPFKTYSESEWYREIANNDFTFSTGIDL